MSTIEPLVDVIIPVFNGARYLAEAIASVLGQTYGRLDLTVVDDGSEDDSALVASRFPGIKVLKQPHVGLGAVLNVALRHGRGAMLAFLDADDRWLPDKLEKQVHCLETNPSLDMVFGHVRQFFQGDQAPILGVAQPGISRCAMLIRRAAFSRVGEFAEDPAVHLFVDWYARASGAGLRSQVLPDVVFERRVHADNMGRREPLTQRQSYLQALRLSLARRARASAPPAPTDTT